MKREQNVVISRTGFIETLEETLGFTPKVRSNTRQVLQFQ